MKKYLSIFCAVLTLTALASCGNSTSSSDSSEVSESSIAETTTEVTTETKTETAPDETTTQKATQEKTTKARKIINVKNYIGDVFFKIPDGYKKENNSSDESMEAITFKYENGSMINIARQAGASEFDLYNQDDSIKCITLDSFVSSALESNFDKVGDMEEITIGGEFAVKQQAVYSGTSIPLTAFSFVYKDDIYIFMFTDMADLQDETINSINFESTGLNRKTEKVNETIAEKTPLNEQTLDKTYNSDGISFNYCSEWKEYDSQFWAPAFTIENNFRIITRYQTGEFGGISSEKYIEQKKQEFDEKNRPYEIITNKDGYEIFSYLQTDFIKCFCCANGKAVFTIEFRNYSEKYDDIVNKIIDSIQIIPYGMSNPMKDKKEKNTNETAESITEHIAEPTTEKCIETQPPVIETAPVQTILHFVLNMETNCIHIDKGCSAALKIDPENYSEIDIAENDLGSYSGVYWACGKCSEEYKKILPKIE